MVSLAEAWGLDLPEAVEMMSTEVFPVDEVVDKYRKRSEDETKIRKAEVLIKSGGLDVFISVAQETGAVLKQSGFEVEIVSEASLQLAAGNKLQQLNATWSDTGFLPFVQNGRVVTLQKSGMLTATGALFVATQMLVENTGADLTVLVDDEAGVGDAAFVLSEKEGTEKGVQLFGAGVSFNGRLASGTRGEALSIKNVLSEFGKHRPGRKLKQAAVYLTLTRPMLGDGNPLSKLGHVFDFESNEEALKSLVECSDACDAMVEQVVVELESLATKIGMSTVAGDNKLQKFVDHLEQKVEGLLAGEPTRVLAESKKVVNGVRQNYYLNTLNGLRKVMMSLKSVTEEDYLHIGLMIERCLVKLGL